MSLMLILLVDAAVKGDVHDLGDAFDVGCEQWVV